MSKILKNNTGSPVVITDTGITVPASSSYTIAPQDYPLWSASSNVITFVGDSTITVNDGSADLSISDGIDLIKGLFPKKIAVGNLALTQFLSFSGDRAKVEATGITLPSDSTFCTILKQNEITLAAKSVETDIADCSYTVPAGKTFVLTMMAGNYDLSGPILIRFRKQTGGTGSWDRKFRLSLKQHGQDPSHVSMPIPYGYIVGTAGDILKLTYESALKQGSLWACFVGIEY